MVFLIPQGSPCNDAAGTWKSDGRGGYPAPRGAAADQSGFSTADRTLRASPRRKPSPGIIAGTSMEAEPEDGGRRTSVGPQSDWKPRSARRSSAPARRED